MTDQQDDHLGLFGIGADAAPHAKRPVRRRRGAAPPTPAGPAPDLDPGAVRSALASRAGGAPVTAPTPVVPAGRRRRRWSVLIALLVLALIAGGLAVGFTLWRRTPAAAIADFAGPGDSTVIIQIQSGDGVPVIAETLARAQVVASADAFASTAEDDADVMALPPGYYRVRQHASAAAAADELVNPANRVGQVRLNPGGRLADITAGSRTVPGYLSQIAAAACVPVDQRRRCVTAAELQQAASTTPAAQLGVVSWAVADVDGAPEKDKRLEGMIVPGDYNIPPNADAVTTLKAVISASAVEFNSGNIVAAAAAQRMTPYRALIVGSVVQQEVLTPDMPAAARVIYNRLSKPMPLQMDSTVNYAAGHAQIATAAAERSNPSPYNTYVHQGLPPTPISSPGPDAMDAALSPPPGPWLFFVKVDKAGASCFSTTIAQHQQCVEKARAAGVFDG
ncbi:endolytic transglycosylase MltG [Nakamurella aerolata]|uniref:Endolytic murein transglycosylase n=1 Tax=Nakamurella aerolata TaxID=1656892 RepID=A0A849A270_9ACTN|nr:endolytic transglycosylase MltG [Nakamurella aerolata]NNG34709.1 endolytic transglycosylase MltG [Nakamurella aerolata]